MQPNKSAKSKVLDFKDSKTSWKKMKNYKMDCEIHQNNRVICKVGGLRGFFPKFGWNKV